MRGRVVSHDAGATWVELSSLPAKFEHILSDVRLTENGRFLAHGTTYEMDMFFVADGAGERWRGVEARGALPSPARCYPSINPSVAWLPAAEGVRVLQAMDRLNPAISGWLRHRPSPSPDQRQR